MMPVRRTQNWLPSIFNDFFDNDWMVKANATAPAIERIVLESLIGIRRAGAKLILTYYAEEALKKGWVR